MRSSSATTMPSTSASWTECSSVSISAGIGPSVPLPCRRRRCTACVVEQVDDAAELGLLADGELERRDAGAELRP